MILFGGKDFGRRLRLDEVMRAGPRDEISVLIRKGREIRALSPLCEDSVRRQLSISQEEGSHQERINQRLDLGLLAINFCGFSHQLVVFCYGSLSTLRQMEFWWGD